MEYNCILCGSKNLEIALDLGKQYISSFFPEPGVYKRKIQKKFPLRLMRCNGECGLFQITREANTKEIYSACSNYGYRSGINEQMKDHLKKIVQKNEHRNPQIVVDIGSNDGTLLSFYDRKDITKIAVDPLIGYFSQFYEPEIIKINDFFSISNFDEALIGKVDIVTSIAVFYDVEDPIKFASEISFLLNENGIWITEQSYFYSMIEKNSFDTICHEHISYFSIKQMIYISSKVNLKIIDIELNDVNGGSFCVTFSKNTEARVNENIQKYIDQENIFLFSRIDMTNLIDIQSLRESMLNFLNRKKRKGKKIYIYGASTKGNTLLQYYGIDENLVRYAVDRNRDKYSKSTATGIEIISEEQMRIDKPDYLLVLPWHFRNFFIEREKKYLQEGGKMIFPLPKIEIVRQGPNQKTAIITGANGQIAYYLIEILLLEGYIVHGIVRNKPKNLRENLFFHLCDITDEKTLKMIVQKVRPSEFYNLAAVSNAEEKSSEIENVNGIAVGFICKLCSKYQIRLFQAGSVEMFRGKLEINSSLDNYSPQNSYGRSKMIADICVRNFRQNKNLYGCNGILSNIESRRRKKGFLFSKIRKGIQKIDHDDKYIIQVGNIFHKKSWLHCYDAAMAMYLILQQPIPDDYIICSDNFNTVQEVLEMFFYQKFGKDIIWSDEFVIGEISERGFPVIATGQHEREYEKDNFLFFTNEKLKSKCGWKQQYQLQTIVGEFL